MPQQKTNILLIFLMLLFFLSPVRSETTSICGRTATINYQQVLIDTSDTKKGEGLRFYLHKDPLAEDLLNEYQKKTTPQWYMAAVGTLGTGLLIAGITRPGQIFDSTEKTKRGLIIMGLATLVTNYLIVRTIDHNNERPLLRSIDEYNKRNLPRIYFSPYKEKVSGSDGTGFSAGIIKEF